MRRLRATVASAAMLIIATVGLWTPGAMAVDADPSSVEVQRDLVYAQPDDTPLALDAYLPPAGTTPAGAARPGVVLIHGGGWSAGDKSGLESLGRTLAAHGWPAFAVNYRLSSDHPWPDELIDVQTAVAWIQDNATRFDVDPTRLAAFGGSAGGHLAMMLGTNGVADDHPPLRAVVSWSGPTDLRTITPPDVPPSKGGATAGSVAGAIDPVGCGTDPYCIGSIDPEVLPDFVGCAIDDCPQAYAAASPAVQVSSASPPMFLANSETELIPVSQLYEMANALDAAGVVSWLLVVPGDGHADAYSNVALAPSIDFLDRYLAGTASPKTSPKSPPTTAAGSAPLPALIDGWQLPDAADDLPRSLQGEVALWRELLPWVLGIGLVLLVALALVKRARSRRAPPAR